jgi:hypothetical protein
MRHEFAIVQLARELARARRALALERLTPALLPLLVLMAGWAAIALFGLQDRLAPLAASLASVAVLASLALLGARALRRWRAPTAGEARERLARDAGLEPGALDSLEDHPAQLDPVGLALWEREQDRAREIAARAVAAPPRVALNRADPLRLRYLALIAVAAGLFVAGVEAPDRLARAFIPDAGPFLGDKPLEIEAWAAPAGYTGAAPVSLSERIGKRVETPPSVEVTVRVTGPVGAPFLKFDGGGQHRVVEFRRAADDAFEAKLTIPRAGTLRLVRFHTKARWFIAPRADQAPTAAFDGKVSTHGDEVSFKWKAGDDYGVRGLALRVTPVDPPPGLKTAAPIDTVVEGPEADPKTAEGEASLDLLAHPYAGMKVNVRLVAIDAIGQEGVSAPAQVKLPEKIFLQPLARAAIEIRKEILRERRPYAAASKLRKDQTPATLGGYDVLLGQRVDPILTDEFDPGIERAPKAIRRAGKMIDALTFAPQDGYFQDAAVFMGFKGARAALDAARQISDTNEAAAILWQTALRAEYGDSADARRALEEAQRQLSEALARGADMDEINRLSDAVRQAMQNYMSALVAEAMRTGKADQQTQEDTRQKTQLSQMDLDAMMREVQRLAQEGKTAEAQALLQRLAQLLDNLEIRLTQGGAGQGGPQGKDKGDAELNKSVEGLSDTIGKQRALRDDTQKEQQSKRGGQPGQELAQRQQQLGQALDKARRDAQKGGGRDEQDLGKAADAMGKAEEALRRGDYGRAQAEQDEALRQLRAGADRLAQQLLKNQDSRQGQGNQKDMRAGKRDPLGRLIGGEDSNGDEVSVPDAMERERVRDILDELRRRAQDPRRPDIERDYLRRLLERFTGS